MSRFIDEADRSQGTLLPESIDEYVSEENPVRVIEAFVDALDLAVLGFAGVEPKATGRPAYHPAAIKNVCREFIVLCRRWQTQPSEFSGRATRNRYSQQER